MYLKKCYLGSEFHPLKSFFRTLLRTSTLSFQIFIGKKRIQFLIPNQLVLDNTICLFFL